MKKPIVALSGQIENRIIGEWKIPLYATTGFNVESLKEANFIPLISPFLDQAFADELVEKMDGVILTGGADVHPNLYNEEVKEYCQATQPDRDESDLILLKAALKHKKPILCICRGSQIANVYFGGTLYQDINKDTNSTINHAAYTEFNKEISHKITIEKNTPLHNILNVDEIGINSLHHQAVKDLGKGVKVMAKSSEDNIIESWYYEEDSQWIRAYQWHPEMQDANPRKESIYKEFYNECIKRRK